MPRGGLAMELKGRVALVTGGGSGMGRGTARRLVAEGMQVCVVDINGDAAKAVADEIGGPRVHGRRVRIRADRRRVRGVHRRVRWRRPRLPQCRDRRAGSDFGEFSDEDYARIRGVNQDHVVYGSSGDGPAPSGLAPTADRRAPSSRRHRSRASTRRPRAPSTPSRSSPSSDSSARSDPCWRATGSPRTPSAPASPTPRCSQNTRPFMEKLGHHAGDAPSRSPTPS